MAGVGRVLAEDVVVHCVLGFLSVHGNGRTVFLIGAEVLHEGER